jgi:hypothetical protein
MVPVRNVWGFLGIVDLSDGQGNIWGYNPDDMALHYRGMIESWYG